MYVAVHGGTDHGHDHWSKGVVSPEEDYDMYHDMFVYQSGSGGPVPDRYCRLPHRRVAVCALRIMMRARNDGCGPLPVTP